MNETMKEWGNPYNSFNSLKGLLYRDHFDGILSGTLRPPIEVNVDPCNNCNLFCVWCNGKHIINRKDTVMMSRKHLMDLVKFCKSWGVKAVCFAGGGEPTMHPDLAEAFSLATELGLESAIITNGLFSSDEQIKVVAKHARWIGISVDAATDITYNNLKGVNSLSAVKSNIGYLADLQPKELTVKFLIHPLNQYEILAGCKMAKDLGATCFHSRLLSERYVNGYVFNYEAINKQIGECRTLEDEKFKVYTIAHKQDGPSNRRIRFEECLASPLLCMFEADGRVSICIDRKGYPETTLCQHNDVETVRNMWGSTFHKGLMDKICPEKDCEKCTLNIYNELIEAYRNDSFCRNFP